MYYFKIHFYDSERDLGYVKIIGKQEIEKRFKEKIDKEINKQKNEKI